MLNSSSALIIKQETMIRLELQKLCSKLDIDTCTVTDPHVAIELFKNERPDIVIMNMYQYNISAPVLIASLKKEMGQDFVPIILVAEDENSALLMQCLESGADDYITKPVNETLLEIKLKSLLRMRHMHQRVMQEKSTITAYYNEQTRDLKDADKVIYRIHKDLFYWPENMKWKFMAMEIFSGDILCSAQDPCGNHYIFIGDNTGHGLSAAIGSLLTNDVFYTMVRKGFGIVEIAEEMNKKLYNFLPVERFMGACFIKLDKHYESIHVWNAGLPNVLITDSEGRYKSHVESSHLPLGIVSNEQMNVKTEEVLLNDGDQFFCFTDGLLECAGSSETYGYERILESISACDKNSRIANKIISDYKSYPCQCQETNSSKDEFRQHDDITLIHVDCDRHYSRMQRQNMQIKETIQPMGWELAMTLTADMLAHTNPVPLLLNTISDMQGFQNHRENLYMIMTEMFSNTLEHGLLKLDSSIKQEIDGFARYYALRQSRLEALDDAKLDIALTHTSQECSGTLRICMSHNGDSFDYTNLEIFQGINKSLSGRGLSLIAGLCSHFEFSDEGRTTVAEYQWDFNSIQTDESQVHAIQA